MTSAWTGIRRRIYPGARGVDMLILSGVWIAVGWSILAGYDPDPGHTTPIELLGHPVRAGVWFVAAAAALLTAWSDKGSSWGFRLLIVPPALRVFSYLGSFAIGSLRHYGLIEARVGNPANWFDTITWALVTALVYRMAARPDFPTGRAMDRVAQRYGRDQ